MELALFILLFLLLIDYDCRKNAAEASVLHHRRNRLQANFRRRFIEQKRQH